MGADDVVGGSGEA